MNLTSFSIFRDFYALNNSDKLKVTNLHKQYYAAYYSGGWDRVEVLDSKMGESVEVF